MRKTALIAILISALLLPTLTSCIAQQNNVENPTEAEQITQRETEDKTQIETQIETQAESIDSTIPPTNIETESEDGSMSEEYTEIFAETETESKTSAPEQAEETARAEDFVSLCDYRYAVRETHDFSGGKEYAVYFELPEGATMLSFYFQSVSGEDNSSNIHVAIYKTAKLSSPTAPPETDENSLVYSETVSAIPFNTYQVYFEKDKMGSGSYLIKLTSPDENGIYNDTVFLGKGWGQNLPQGYEEYNIQTFVDGKTQRYGLYGGIVIEHNVPKSSIGELNEEPITEKIEGEKLARVIVLSGQSNAAGATPYTNLERHVSPEKYQEYLNGYDNVKIFYASAALNDGEIVIKNQSDEFVNTKLGQGYLPSYLGPEVGLAEYLSQTYPDETFYIIKYGVGSASMNGHFNPNDDNKASALTALKEKMRDGLKLLENDGYTPKIVAFLWMQGESNANNLNSTYSYYGMQKMMVEQLRAEFSDYAPARGIAFIDAGIANHGTWPTHMLMNALKKKYSYESRANYYADTVAAGLVTLTEDENTDKYHYVSTSLITLGHLFGEKISEHID